MKMTRNGICYDLSQSPYVYSLSYPQEVEYRFSSELNMNKFIERLEINRASINESLSKRFKVEVRYNILCDFMLYTKVEKRGFYMVVEGREALWQNEVKLEGQKLTVN